jgi:hypothetical protein
MKPVARNRQGAGTAVAGSSGVSGMFSGGKGSKFVFVLDKSSSMGQAGKFQAVIDELKRQLNALKPQYSFYIIFFDTQAYPMRANGLQSATPQNLRPAAIWLDSQYPSGGTDPTDAIMRALDLDPHTIWILSDGEFSTHIVDTVNAANRLKLKRVCINTIAFYDQAEMTLKPLAAANEGAYRYVPDPRGSALKPSPYQRPGTNPRFTPPPRRYP